MKIIQTSIVALIAWTSATVSLASPATHFSVTAPPSTTSGAQFSAIIKALDASNKVDNGYVGTVHLTSSDSDALLPADFSLSSGNGFAQVTLLTAGSQTVTATDTVTASITGASATISVAANNNPANHFSVTAPSSAKVGIPFDVTVAAVDQLQHITSSYSGTVHVTSTDAAAVLPADAVLTHGVGTFSVTLMTVGQMQRITVQDTGNAMITGMSSGIATTAGTAMHLNLNAAGGVLIYSPFPVSISARDVGGNLVMSYSGLVHVTSTDSTAVLPASNVMLNNGSGTAFVTFQSIGNFTVSAADVATPGIQGMTNLIASNPLVDGSYDPTFGSSGRRLVLQSSGGFVLEAARADGRVLLAGNCKTLDGSFGSTCVVQLEKDGQSFDNTFGSGYVNLNGFAGYTGCAQNLIALRLLADGRIVLVSRGCSASVLIAVLKADGSDFDRSLAGGAGWLEDGDAAVFGSGNLTAAVQDDGRVLVAGLSLNTTSSNYDMMVARFSADLSGRDPTFAPLSSIPGVKLIAFDLGGTGTNTDNAGTVASLPGGKILVTGSAAGSSTEFAAFARLLSDGSFDPAFGALGGRVVVGAFPCTNFPNAAIADRYGRIVFACGGNTLYRLDASGSLDSTFTTTSVPGFIYGMTLQPDGKTIVISRTQGVITRLARDGSLDTSFGPGGEAQRTFTDASGYASVPYQVVFAGQSGLLVSGESFTGTGSVDDPYTFEFGIMRLADDVIYGDGFGD